MNNTYYALNDFRNYQGLYLEHYGILGMKWGVRRYQNEDGSYTAAGRKRYGMNLDVNNRSRKNIAKIRLGEARRRYDVAKKNSKTKGRNDYRVAETRGRVRAAKTAVRNADRVDKGAKLAAKGKTISKNNIKTTVSLGAAYVGSRALNSFLKKRMKDLGAEGRLTKQHVDVASAINNIGSISMYSISAIAGAHYNQQNVYLRSYNIAKSTGNASINRTGSEEYKAVVKRSKKNK